MSDQSSIRSNLHYIIEALPEREEDSKGEIVNRCPISHKKNLPEMISSDHIQAYQAGTY